MKRYLIICATLAAVVSPFLPPAARAAFPDYRSVQAKYPQADAVVLYDSTIVSADGTGRVTKRFHRAAMLFTDNAINRYGDPRLLFDAKTQELRVLVARAHMRDGSTVDTQRNGVNQTTPFAFDRTPDYTDWQETVVTHVGIEKGCVAELEYAIVDREPSARLSGTMVFSAEDPVEVRVLAVQPPARSTLRHVSTNGAPAPVAADGRYTWTVRDIPGRTPVNGGAFEGDYWPMICYSTAATWQDALGALAADVAAAAAPFPEIEGPVREAVAGARTDEERVLAIARLAREAVTAIDPPYALLAAPPRRARRVYETGYATPIDHAVLLASMLRSAGFEPACALVSAGRAVGNDAAAPELFVRALVAAPAKDAGEMLLDPRAAYEHDPSYALAGKTILRLGATPFLSPLPVRNAGASASSLDLTLEPGKEGSLAGKGTIRLSGAFSPYYLVRSGDTGLEKFLKERVARLFGGAELVDWNPRVLDRGGAEIDFSFAVALPEKSAGGRAYLALPKPFESAIAGIDRPLLDRSAVFDPLRFEPCLLSVSCSIEPPKGWRVVALPRAIESRNDAGSVRVTADAAADGKRVVRRELAIERDIVGPPLYGSLGALLAAFADDRLVLEKE